MDERKRILPILSDWQTAAEYSQERIELTPAKFLEVTNLLLENPNLNSSHLFRADILFDSAGILRTALEKEKQCSGPLSQWSDEADDHHSSAHSEQEADFQPTLDGIAPDRVVIRKLVPRNVNIDRPLDQKCLIYERHHQDSGTSYTVVYVPHVRDETDIPWYHPPVKALAYVYEQAPSSTESIEERADLSVCFLPFNNTPCQISNRLHRTFISLLNTFLRLSKTLSTPSDGHPTSDHSAMTNISTAPSALKDTILPQHIVQNTYAKLKQAYAPDLIARWVESTEPAKHVFEDLSIAAFLIELWKTMYRNRPFPGFIDIACGNGVLVYILIQEGYKGWGFDARRRKTWDILGINEHLDERICVPQPFLDVLSLSAEDALPDSKVHNGIFPQDTFIISNHADELTPWTPLLAALSSPQSSLPFLAIPCCSHALSGAKHRYTPKSLIPTQTNITAAKPSTPTTEQHVFNESDPQPVVGDLRALRAQKSRAANHTDDKSMYACLTKKVVALAEEVGYQVEMTLMRIPSTRNIGVVGGGRGRVCRMEYLTRKPTEQWRRCQQEMATLWTTETIERKCNRS